VSILSHQPPQHCHSPHRTVGTVTLLYNGPNSTALRGYVPACQDPGRAARIPNALRFRCPDGRPSSLIDPLSTDPKNYQLGLSARSGLGLQATSVPPNGEQHPQMPRNRTCRSTQIPRNIAGISTVSMSGIRFCQKAGPLRTTNRIHVHISTPTTPQTPMYIPGTLLTFKKCRIPHSALPHQNPPPV
jgi:hypothetical protein